MPVVTLREVQRQSDRQQVMYRDKSLTFPPKWFDLTLAEYNDARNRDVPDVFPFDHSATLDPGGDWEVKLLTAGTLDFDTVSGKLEDGDIAIDATNNRIFIQLPEEKEYRDFLLSDKNLQRDGSSKITLDELVQDGFPGSVRVLVGVATYDAVNT